MATYRIFVRALLVLVGLLLAGGELIARGQVAAPPVPEPPPVRHERSAILKLSGDIDNVLASSLRTRLESARKAGCTIIIYDIDTYGGLLTSAIDISKMTKGFTKETGIPIIAWVHPKAYSAGAIIALSCKQIYMSPSTSMGDCAPIAIDMWNQAHGLNEDLKAKVQSPLLQELDDSCAVNGYPRLLAYAMVVRELEVYRLMHRDTGEVRFVDPKGRDELLKETRKPNAAEGANQPEIHVWKLDPEPVDSDKTLLTVGPEQAVEMHLAKRAVLDERDLTAALNITGDPMRLDSTWAENLTRFFCNWWVRFALFVAMLVLAYIEFSHPGVSIPGIGALICLALLIGGPFLTGIAQSWEIIVIILGVLLIIGDIAIHGGVGMFAIPGFILLAIGLVASFIPPDPNGHFLPQSSSAYDGLQKGLSVVIFGSLLSLGIFYFLARYLYITPGFSRLQLAPSLGPVPVSVTDAADRSAHEVVFIGSIGLVEADLRPAGKARFDQHLLDVVADGEWIPVGTPVEVTEVSGTRIVVRKQKPDGPQPLAT